MQSNNKLSVHKLCCSYERTLSIGFIQQHLAQRFIIIGKYRIEVSQNIWNDFIKAIRTPTIVL